MTSMTALCTIVVIIIFCSLLPEQAAAQAVPPPGDDDDNNNDTYWRDEIAVSRFDVSTFDYNPMPPVPEPEPEYVETIDENGNIIVSAKPGLATPSWYYAHMQLAPGTLLDFILCVDLPSAWWASRGDKTNEEAAVDFAQDFAPRLSFRHGDITSPLLANAVITGEFTRLNFCESRLDHGRPALSAHVTARLPTYGYTGPIYTTVWLYSTQSEWDNALGSLAHATVVVLVEEPMTSDNNQDGDQQQLQQPHNPSISTYSPTSGSFWSSPTSPPLRNALLINPEGELVVVNSTDPSYKKTHFTPPPQRDDCLFSGWTGPTCACRVMYGVFEVDYSALFTKKTEDVVNLRDEMDQYASQYRSSFETDGHWGVPVFNRTLESIYREDWTTLPTDWDLQEDITASPPLHNNQSGHVVDLSSPEAEEVAALLHYKELFGTKHTTLVSGDAYDWLQLHFLDAVAEDLELRRDHLAELSEVLLGPNVARFVVALRTPTCLYNYYHTFRDGTTTTTTRTEGRTTSKITRNDTHVVTTSSHYDATGQYVSGPITSIRAIPPLPYSAAHPNNLHLWGGSSSSSSSSRSSTTSPQSQNVQKQKQQQRQTDADIFVEQWNDLFYEEEGLYDYFNMDVLHDSPDNTTTPPSPHNAPWQPPANVDKLSTSEDSVYLRAKWTQFMNKFHTSNTLKLLQTFSSAFLTTPLTDLVDAMRAVQDPVADKYWEQREEHLANVVKKKMEKEEAVQSINAIQSEQNNNKKLNANTKKNNNPPTAPRYLSSSSSSSNKNNYQSLKSEFYFQNSLLWHEKNNNNNNYNNNAKRFNTLAVFVPQNKSPLDTSLINRLVRHITPAGHGSLLDPMCSTPQQVASNAAQIQGRVRQVLCADMLSNNANYAHVFLVVQQKYPEALLTPASTPNNKVVTILGIVVGVVVGVFVLMAIASVLFVLWLKKKSKEEEKARTAERQSAHYDVEPGLISPQNIAIPNDNNNNNHLNTTTVSIQTATASPPPTQQQHHHHNELFDEEEHLDHVHEDDIVGRDHLIDIPPLPDHSTQRSVETSVIGQPSRRGSRARRPSSADSALPSVTCGVRPGGGEQEERYEHQDGEIELSISSFGDSLPSFEYEEGFAPVGLYSATPTQSIASPATKLATKKNRPQTPSTNRNPASPGGGGFSRHASHRNTPRNSLSITSRPNEYILPANESVAAKRAAAAASPTPPPAHNKKKQVQLLVHDKDLAEENIVAIQEVSKNSQSSSSISKKSKKSARSHKSYATFKSARSDRTYNSKHGYYSSYAGSLTGTHKSTRTRATWGSARSGYTWFQILPPPGQLYRFQIPLDYNPFDLCHNTAKRKTLRVLPQHGYQYTGPFQPPQNALHVLKEQQRQQGTVAAAAAAAAALAQKEGGDAFPANPTSTPPGSQNNNNNTNSNSGSNNSDKNNNQQQQQQQQNSAPSSSNNSPIPPQLPAPAGPAETPPQPAPTPPTTMAMEEGRFDYESNPAAHKIVRVWQLNPHAHYPLTNAITYNRKSTTAQVFRFNTSGEVRRKKPLLEIYGGPFAADPTEPAPIAKRYTPAHTKTSRYKLGVLPNDTWRSSKYFSDICFCDRCTYYYVIYLLERGVVLPIGINIPKRPPDLTYECTSRRNRRIMTPIAEYSEIENALTPDKEDDMYTHVAASDVAVKHLYTTNTNTPINFPNLTHHYSPFHDQFMARLASPTFAARCHWGPPELNVMRQRLPFGYFHSTPRSQLKLPALQRAHSKAQRARVFEKLKNQHKARIEQEFQMDLQRHIAEKTAKYGKHYRVDPAEIIDECKMVAEVELLVKKENALRQQFDKEVQFDEDAVIIENSRRYAIEDRRARKEEQNYKALQNSKQLHHNIQKEEYKLMRRFEKDKQARAFRKQRIMNLINQHILGSSFQDPMAQQQHQNRQANPNKLDYRNLNPNMLYTAQRQLHNAQFRIGSRSGNVDNDPKVAQAQAFDFAQFERGYQEYRRAQHYVLAYERKERAARIRLAKEYNQHLTYSRQQFTDALILQQDAYLKQNPHRYNKAVRDNTGELCLLPEFFNYHQQTLQRYKAQPIPKDLPPVYPLNFGAEQP